MGPRRFESFFKNMISILRGHQIQKIVEIPTVEEVVEEQEVPEIQVVNKVVEVPQVGNQSLRKAFFCMELW